MTTALNWTQRHIRLMRTQRGHWCFVEGCTGAQPLMWVPTEAEVRAESRRFRGRAIDIPPVTSPLDYYLARYRPALYAWLTARRAAEPPDGPAGGQA